jgi:DNA polymerase-3 subunit epsilon
MEGLIALAVGAVVSCLIYLTLTALNRRSSSDYVGTRPSNSNPPAPLSRAVLESPTLPASHMPEVSVPPNADGKPNVPIRQSITAIDPDRDSPYLRTTPPNSPKSVIFFDVETTGLTVKDRLVTLAAIRLLNPDTCATRVQAEFMYLVFDPERKSHPRAEAVHGYSDWTLRHQDTFDIHAQTIEKFFNSSDLLVAHNTEFDLAFYNREMERAGRSPFANRTFCTMTAYQQRGFLGSASLDSVCRRIGLARETGQHGALEDSWLALRVYLWLKSVPFSAPLPAEFRNRPSNLKPVPPLPDGPLPRRRRTRKAALATHSTNAARATGAPH